MSIAYAPAGRMRATRFRAQGSATLKKLSARQLFGNFKGFVQSDASTVYDILERGPPKDEDSDDVIKLVGC